VEKSTLTFVELNSKTCVTTTTEPGANGNYPDGAYCHVQGEKKDCYNGGKLTIRDGYKQYPKVCCPKGFHTSENGDWCCTEEKCIMP